MRDISPSVDGAPLAVRTADLIRCLSDDDWAVSVVATPAALAWLDTAAVRELTGAAPRVEFRDLRQPKRVGPAEAVVMCPATFNTVNRAAAGAAECSRPLNGSLA